MFLRLLLSLLFILAANTAWSATYYMRADGTAANKAAATSSAAAATSMSVAKHNSETFAAGDTVYISSQGGTYTASVGNSCIVAPSSGDDGNPITYAAVPGETPVIDISWLDDKTGWTSIGSGKYTKGSYGFYARAVWEDGVALKRATSAANVGINGDWFYTGGTITYKPSSLTPANHDLVGIWFENSDWDPYAIDLRERSNITVSGLRIDKGSIGVAQNTSSSESTLIKNIKIHDCTFNYSIWAIWGQVKFNNCIFQDSEFYNNTINYSNGAISVWTGSDMGVHTQHVLRSNIHHNTINHHYSIDSTHNWSYAIDPASAVYDDHEAISFQDPVSCTVSHNQITCDLPMDGDNHRRAIFLYGNPTASSMDSNIVTYNRIVGGYDFAIYFSGASPAQGNIIACNVLQSSASPSSDASAIYIGLESNSASGINYVCNNTINYSSTTNYPYGIYIYKTNSGKWTVKNNIVTTSRGGALAEAVTTKTDYVFSNNNYLPGEFLYDGGWKNFAAWQAYNWDISGSYVQDPVLSTYNSSITTGSPTACKSGGTPVEGITVISGVGQAGIDGKLFHPTAPSMGASQYYQFTRIPIQGYTAP
jgi:hypothetical protein